MDDCIETPSASSGTIALPAILDLEAAAALKEDILALLAYTAHPQVDASKVQRVTSPCFQVLLAAAKSAEKQGGALSIQNPSHQFIDAAHVLALGSVFGIEGQVQ